MKKKKLLKWGIPVAVLLVGATIFCIFGEPMETIGSILRRFVYCRPVHLNTAFHTAIANANRIVIRGEGYDCCGRADNSAEKILLEITDPAIVAEIRANTQFLDITYDEENWNMCMCCGWPRMDWYEGKRRVAFTAIQHSSGIRWRGFSHRMFLGHRIGYADAPLTEESCHWYTNWFSAHGIELHPSEPVRLNQITEDDNEP